MKAILLLAANFVRAQLVLLAIVVGYIVCLAGFLAWHEQVPDLEFFVRQQSVYAIALGTLVVIPALQNERKSRRILGVLSKGIHRWQYLGGLLCGAVLIAGIFCVAVEVAGLWLAHRANLPVTGLTELMLALLLASAAGASVGLFCSVLLHPVLATGAAALILLLPYAVEAKGMYPPGHLFPVFNIMHVALTFTFRKPGMGLWPIAASAVIQTIVFWAAASAAFARKDVTVTTE
jgi:ABC-type transport system involved in multi-copper enzyme maturation permease subunit